MSLSSVWRVSLVLAWVSRCASSGIPTYYCIQDQTTTITGQSGGFINTLNEGGEFYGNNMRCTWIIDAGDNHLIQLTILSLDLQWVPTYTTCSGYDNLQIIDGSTNDGVNAASVCHDRNPQTVISQGSQLYLHFYTTHQNFGSHRGVHLRFDIFASDACLPSWFQVPGGDEGECWLISDAGKASWMSSQDICAYNHANLASITSEHEYLALIEHGKAKSISEAWIGLSDIQTEGTFKWIDKKSLSFTRNITGNGEWQDCIAQDINTGNWVVHKCDDNKLYYVCKAKKDGSTTIYQAETASTPPKEGSKGNKVLVGVVIGAVGLLVVIGLIIVYCCCLRSKYPNLCKRQRSKAGSIPDSDQELQFRPSGTVPQTLPTINASAPPLEIMFHDPQMVAPPTYEESRYHPRI